MFNSLVNKEGGVWVWFSPTQFTKWVDERDAKWGGLLEPAWYSGECRPHSFLRAELDAGHLWLLQPRWIPLLTQTTERKNGGHPVPTCRRQEDLQNLVDRLNNRQVVFFSPPPSPQSKTVVRPGAETKPETDPERSQKANTNSWDKFQLALHQNLQVLRKWISTYFIFLKRFYLFIFRERGREGEREGEKHQCVVVSHTPPAGDLAWNPRVCPDW